MVMGSPRRLPESLVKNFLRSFVQVYGSEGTEVCGSIVLIVRWYSHQQRSSDPVL